YRSGARVGEQLVGEVDTCDRIQELIVLFVAIRIRREQQIAPQLRLDLIRVPRPFAGRTHRQRRATLVNPRGRAVHTGAGVTEVARIIAGGGDDERAITVSMLDRVVDRAGRDKRVVEFEVTVAAGRLELDVAVAPWLPAEAEVDDEA